MGLRKDAWMGEELVMLHENYQLLDHDLATKIGRTENAVASKRRELGLRKHWYGLEPSYKLQLSDTDKAYLAGLLDGDGSIFLSEYRYPEKRKTRVKGIHSVISFAVSICSANKEFVDEILKMIGGVACRRSKVHYEVRVSRQADIKQLLEALVPYLRLKKKEAKTMIEFCKSRLSARKERNNIPISEEDRLLMKRVKKLNTTTMSRREWK